ncbi:aldehyde dehydrogenase family protein [Thalassotalea psychrophila]|uniref:Aldehyde dehydrogenase family protein n=1 Tax=Thalassotalea psychrophila TaxID=3065647 RepID=A0ABY9TT43_9GAMM|nr:aldehyde dehydrogenase family protein [Colwelliaceae bacterium SQ149]
MKQCDQFYINGEWVNPLEPQMMDIINPANETVVGQVALGNQNDVDLAVKSANHAFETWSQTSREQRLEYLDRIIALYKERINEMAEAITTEMGAPKGMALEEQSAIGIVHFETTRKSLESFQFEETKGITHVAKEAIGVCGLITPWNWPMNQIACKVAPAIACGCTVVLKPSEFAPLSAQIFAQIVHDAGLPAGVFNMVYGDGPVVGTALSSHPDIEMVSLTGSTRAGKSVSEMGAQTIKRVTLELGGKSPNIILEDADIESCVTSGAEACFDNTGQSCDAPTRMLVPAKYHQRAVEVAKSVAEATVVGDPNLDTTTIGPLSNKAQFEKVQNLVAQAIEQGSELVIGGPGRPEGLTAGYYVKPTVFANVTNDMLIAQQEVFGPVLSIIPYNNEDEAVAIANDTPYGLAGYIQGNDLDKVRSIARRIRAGTIYLNNPDFDAYAPFGGYKQSGNGREWAHFAFDDFLEIKGIVGF